jgi:predicted HTH transcriptional regulator
MSETGLPLPVFNIADIFTVILQRPEKSSVKSSERIIIMITEHPKITIPEIAAKMQLSTRAIVKQLAKLKLLRVIQCIGSDKEGYLEILKNKSKE